MFRYVASGSPFAPYRRDRKDASRNPLSPAPNHPRSPARCPVPIYAIDDREPVIEPGAYVHPDAVVIGRVVLGAGATVWPAAVLRGDYGEITVGARTSVQDGTVIHATEELPTRMGADCVIGHLVHLEGCTIEDRSLVGSGSTVLHLAVVRSGALVGAGALVPPRMEVPSGAQALGVPAKLREARATRPRRSPRRYAGTSRTARATATGCGASTSPPRHRMTGRPSLGDVIADLVAEHADLDDDPCRPGRTRTGTARHRPRAGRCATPSATSRTSTSGRPCRCSGPTSSGRA